MRFPSLAGLGLAVLASACATSGQMSTDGLARLQRARAARPGDPKLTRDLGLAFYKAARYDSARFYLAQSVARDPRDGAATLYLGLAAERQGDFGAARTAYQTYQRYGRTSRVRRQLEARLAALTRLEIQAATKSAIAREQQIAAQPGSPRTVAVMPLRFVGPDTTLKPLERGLAELITIDLSRSSKLTVVERARLQALLDEIKLQRSGATDSTTNVRAGKIIQAGSIVNGSIMQDGDRLRVDAAIVSTQTSQASGGATSENVLAELFTIEKAIVLKLFEDLGVVLTTAERALIEERPTRSMQAFLAYSRGLKLEDEGKYDDAARSFNDASRLDPSFGAASQRSRESSQAALGVTLNIASVEASTTGTPEGNVARQSEQGGAPAASGNPSENSPRNQADNINQSSAGGATAGAGAGSSSGTTNSNSANRDALSAATGSESGRSTTRLTVVIRLPH